MLSHSKKQVLRGYKMTKDKKYFNMMVYDIVKNKKYKRVVYSHYDFSKRTYKNFIKLNNEFVEVSLKMCENEVAFLDENGLHDGEF